MGSYYIIWEYVTISCKCKRLYLVDKYLVIYIEFNLYWIIRMKICILYIHIPNIMVYYIAKKKDRDAGLTKMSTTYVWWKLFIFTGNKRRKINTTYQSSLTNFFTITIFLLMDIFVCISYHCNCLVVKLQ